MAPSVTSPLAAVVAATVHATVREAQSASEDATGAMSATSATVEAAIAHADEARSGWLVPTKTQAGLEYDRWRYGVRLVRFRAQQSERAREANWRAREPQAVERGRERGESEIQRLLLASLPASSLSDRRPRERSSFIRVFAAPVAGPGTGHGGQEPPYPRASARASKQVAAPRRCDESAGRHTVSGRTIYPNEMPVYEQAQI